MCPLRVILIFLSATIAGFFLIRGLKAEPDFEDDDVDDKGSESPRAPVPLRSKVLALPKDNSMSYRSMYHSVVLMYCRYDPLVGSAMKTGFWTMVDMASGRYLWRTLVSPPAKCESEKAR